MRNISPLCVSHVEGGAILEGYQVLSAGLYSSKGPQSLQVPHNVEISLFVNSKYGVPMYSDCTFARKSSKPRAPVFRVVCDHARVEFRDV